MGKLFLFMLWITGTQSTTEYCVDKVINQNHIPAIIRLDFKTYEKSRIYIQSKVLECIMEKEND